MKELGRIAIDGDLQITINKLSIKAEATENTILWLNSQDYNKQSAMKLIESQKENIRLCRGIIIRDLKKIVKASYPQAQHFKIAKSEVIVYE